MKLRLVFTCLLATLPAAQAAQPCPYVTIGWSAQYSPSSPITSVLYDSGLQFLYVIFQGNIVSAYSNVPTSVMQAFSSSQQPMQVYQGLVLGRYHPMLLSNQQNCPLLNSNGMQSLWSF